jgi:hypothetical protein
MSGSEEKLSELVLAKHFTMNRRFAKDLPVDPNIIKLNIGGTYFTTLLQTLDRRLSRVDDKNQLYPANLFQEILHGQAPLRFDEKHALFFDRNPQYFNYVLDFLRLVDSPMPMRMPSSSNELLKSIYEEACYYKVDALKDKIYGLCLVSSILSESQTATLFRICKLRAQKWNLIYKGSRDGFFASSFHTACDRVGTTLIIVKTSMNYIFGGCTLASWDYLARDSIGGAFREDHNAFLFSLKNKLGRPFRINVTDGKKAIKVRHDHGPVFGDDDLVLFSPSGSFYASNNDNTCYAPLGKSFKLTPDIVAEVKEEEFLAGDMFFKPAEVEVFEIAK